MDGFRRHQYAFHGILREQTRCQHTFNILTKAYRQQLKLWIKLTPGIFKKKSVLWPCHEAFKTLGPWPGIEPVPLQWKHRVLITRLLGKSLTPRICPYPFKKMVFHGGSDGKESCNAGDLGCIPGSGRSPGEGNGNPLQYSCLENPMDRGAGGLLSVGLQESVMTEWVTFSLSLSERCYFDVVSTQLGSLITQTSCSRSLTLLSTDAF